MLHNNDIPMTPTVEFAGVSILALLTLITMNTAVGIITIFAGISTILLNSYRYGKESGRITPKQKKPEKDERDFFETQQTTNEKHTGSL